MIQAKKTYLLKNIFQKKEFSHNKYILQKKIKKVIFLNINQNFLKKNHLKKKKNMKKKIMMMKKKMIIQDQPEIIIITKIIKLQNGEIREGQKIQMILKQNGKLKCVIIGKCMDFANMGIHVLLPMEWMNLIKEK